MTNGERVVVVVVAGVVVGVGGVGGEMEQEGTEVEISSPLLLSG